MQASAFIFFTLQRVRFEITKENISFAFYFIPRRDERKFGFYVEKRIKRKKPDQEGNQTPGGSQRTQTEYSGRHVEKVQE
jgi:hypothetical protein